MNVIQNILTPEQQKEIKSIMESAQFPWYWNETTVDYMPGSGDKSPGQLIHGFIFDSLNLRSCSFIFCSPFLLLYNIIV